MLLFCLRRGTRGSAPTHERAIEWTQFPSPQTATLFAARRWRESENRWIVLVASTDDVQLAVVEADRGNARRIARTVEPFTSHAQWSLLPEDFRPSAYEADDPLAADADLVIETRRGAAGFADVFVHPTSARTGGITFGWNTATATYHCL